MKNQYIYKLFIALSVLAAFISIAMGISGNLKQAGPFVILFFVFLALGFFGIQVLKGYVFTLMIFAGVAVSLYYPSIFIQIGGFELTGLITPLIQIIMFGMGTTMSIRDFAGVLKSPKGVAVGVSAQLIIMPIVGFILATMSNFPPEIAAGIVLIGCSPSGVASNVMAYIAKANLALSITITSISTLIAPVSTPTLMKLLAGQFIEIDMLSMMWSIVQMIILPIGAGLLFNHFFNSKTRLLNQIMPFVSMVAIGLIIVVITAAGRDSLLEIGMMLLLIVFIHNTVGYFLGYGYGKLLGLSEQDCRTLAIEVGMQNGGLASGIAHSLGKIATMGLAPAVFGPLQNITGSILASYFKDKPLPDVVDEKEPLTVSDNS